MFFFGRFALPFIDEITHTHTQKISHRNLHLFFLIEFPIKPSSRLHFIENIFVSTLSLTQIQIGLINYNISCYWYWNCNWRTKPQSKYVFYGICQLKVFGVFHWRWLCFSVPRFVDKMPEPPSPCYCINKTQMSDKCLDQFEWLIYIEMTNEEIAHWELWHLCILLYRSWVHLTNAFIITHIRTEVHWCNAQNIAQIIV